MHYIHVVLNQFFINMLSVEGLVSLVTSEFACFCLGTPSVNNKYIYLGNSNIYLIPFNTLSS